MQWPILRPIPKLQPFGSACRDTDPRPLAPRRPRRSRSYAQSPGRSARPPPFARTRLGASARQAALVLEGQVCLRGLAVDTKAASLQTYGASPSCFKYVALSQNRYSSSITLPIQ